MNSSESEGFESADEGIGMPTRKERKKRLSSSNYSDNISDQETNKSFKKVTNKTSSNQEASTDCWDNFDFEATSEADNAENKSAATTASSKKEVPKTEDTENTGWDDFDDWGDTNVVTDKEPAKQTIVQQEQDINAVTDRLASTSTKSEGWNWGWGMNSIFSSATMGITSITSQVSQGITNVLDSGIGAPDPEELARRSVKTDVSESKEIVEQKPEVKSNANEASFPFGNLFSGVTKFVESTGTKVISGGLDTLETIGKKTMEVLQDGDPLLAKKRAMLGLDSGDKPILSQILREAKEKADEEDKLKEAKREAKEVHYETLFDDFEGLVHLEALEMLSKQINMRIEERLRSTPPEKRQDIKETLQQVAELCEMPEEDEDDDDDDEVSADTPKAEVFHDKLQKATKDIGLKLQFQPLIKQYTDELSWLGACEAEVGGACEAEVGGARAVYKRAVGGLARATALAVQLYHRTAEMLLVKGRRSTADEADALTQMTVVLTKHISELATLFTEKLNARAGDGEQVNDYITNVFLEAGNSSKYIENAFQLTLPIIQIGAV